MCIILHGVATHNNILARIVTRTLFQIPTVLTQRKLKIKNFFSLRQEMYHFSK